MAVVETAAMMTESESESESEEAPMPLPPTQALGFRHSRTKVRVMSPLQYPMDGGRGSDLPEVAAGLGWDSWGSEGFLARGVLSGSLTFRADKKMQVWCGSEGKGRGLFLPALR